MKPRLPFLHSDCPHDAAANMCSRTTPCLESIDARYTNTVVGHFTRGPRSVILPGLVAARQPLCVISSRHSRDEECRRNKCHREAIGSLRRGALREAPGAWDRIYGAARVMFSGGPVGDDGRRWALIPWAKPMLCWVLPCSCNRSHDCLAPSPHPRAYQVIPPNRQGGQRTRHPIVEAVRAVCVTRRLQYCSKPRAQEAHRFIAAAQRP